MIIKNHLLNGLRFISIFLISLVVFSALDNYLNLGWSLWNRLCIVFNILALIEIMKDTIKKIKYNE